MNVSAHLGRQGEGCWAPGASSLIVDQLGLSIHSSVTKTTPDFLTTFHPDDSQFDTGD